ncbi:F-box/kelch-repeat protein At1g23390 [Lycium ferocissimum]|uniref:F-box/kelch-repeat protein At1g23390 n=1 Tax=Lycium ferocissimum TaxID=112874 RepID=UPI0028157EBC|nr:F-box/kelch-repeat protein At1g23390 [Lycium ferocissimum]
MAILLDDEAPIHGDVLETILSHVPLIYLVPASYVSKSWSRAITTSLQCFNKAKPWLIIHTQCTRSPYDISVRAYDPRSHVWIEISQPSIKYVSALRSSHSNLLYMLSPSKLSFSFDPMNITWHHVDAPRVWRTDPIVSHVGGSIIIAGGTCDFEDDPLAVEVYNTETRTWEMCESMPAILKDSAASTWLSIATTRDKLIVTEKFTGVTYCFDPKLKKWAGPYELRPDPRIFHSVIGFSNNRLILIGMIGDAENVTRLKIWKVDTESFECEELGEMPSELIKKLKSETFGVSSISVCLAGDYAYMSKSSELAEEIVGCEFINGGGVRWWSMKNEAAGDGNRSERVVFTCSVIGLGDLQRAMSLGNRKFALKL